MGVYRRAFGWGRRRSRGTGTAAGAGIPGAPRGAAGDALQSVPMVMPQPRNRGSHLLRPLLPATSIRQNKGLRRSHLRSWAAALPGSRSWSPEAAASPPSPPLPLFCRGPLGRDRAGSRMTGRGRPLAQQQLTGLQTLTLREEPSGPDPGLSAHLGCAWCLSVLGLVCRSLGGG